VCPQRRRRRRRKRRQLSAAASAGRSGAPTTAVVDGAPEAICGVSTDAPTTAAVDGASAPAAARWAARCLRARPRLRRRLVSVSLLSDAPVVSACTSGTGSAFAAGRACASPVLRPSCSSCSIIMSSSARQFKMRGVRSVVLGVSVSAGPAGEAHVISSSGTGPDKYPARPGIATITERAPQGPRGLRQQGDVPSSALSRARRTHILLAY